MLRFLTDEEKEKAQRRGYMCEHLLCLYSMTSNRTALYNDTFPVYLSGYGAIDVVLFGLLGERGGELECIRELLNFPIQELNVISPKPLKDPIKIKTRHIDWDFHIDVERLNLDLKGHKYKNLRYNMKRARKKGYSSRFSRDFTRNHVYVLSRHMANHNLDVWDFEELLSLERFFKEHNHGFMLEAYDEDKLIGFDIVDFFEDNRVMVVPLGIYLEKPSLADFLMYENLTYAKENGYQWLDVGLTCQNVGLQNFKMKWFAEPKYKLFVQTIENKR